MARMLEDGDGAAHMIKADELAARAESAARARNASTGHVFAQVPRCASARRRQDGEGATQIAKPQDLAASVPGARPHRTYPPALRCPSALLFVANWFVVMRRSGGAQAGATVTPSAFRINSTS